MNKPLRTLGEGRFMRLVASDGWEWAERIGCSGAVAIVAITPDDELVLVEQHRIAHGQSVIELPAGLVGDVAGSEAEDWRVAATRELAEETGFQAGKLEALALCPTSPGFSSEVVRFVLAGDLRRVSSGGGDASEQIAVHLVPRCRCYAWLQTQAASGKAISALVYAGIGLICEHADAPQIDA